MEYAVRLSPPPRGITRAYLVTPGSLVHDQLEMLVICVIGFWGECS